MDARLADGQDAEPAVRHLVPVAVRTVEDARAPSLPQPRNLRQLVDNARREHEPPPAFGRARGEHDFEPAVA
jgi:hypothetical protein